VDEAELTYWQELGEAIYLKNEANNSFRVLAIRKPDDVNVTFEEMCDQYFVVTLTQEQAIQALQEAIQWLNQR
jgi:hypothetical protein